MGTIIGDYVGTTIGIHSPFPTKHQGDIFRQVIEFLTTDPALSILVHHLRTLFEEYGRP